MSDKKANENIKSVVEGDILTITVDLSKDYGESKSGKTIVIASSLGNVDVDEENHKGVKLGLNIYRHKDK